MVSFEKLKSDLNQTWFIDIICEPSYVHAVNSLASRLLIILKSLNTNRIQVQAQLSHTRPI